MSQLRRLGRSLFSGLTYVPVIYFIHENFFTFVPVQGASMQPTLNPVSTAKETFSSSRSSGDIVFVSRLLRHFWDTKRGEVVVLRSPDQGPRKRLIKRVVALEGDRIYNCRTGKEVEIPRGCCWIEGDNRALSRDSASHYGPVPLGLIEGRVIAIVWPPGRWQMLSAPQRTESSVDSGLGLESELPSTIRALAKPTRSK
ncbi:hypothetical protein CCYA_CCYA15G3917 [Cyanidiococcus yangmingshanensis]|nr:hypothetical protein CCYA_CCYA15G3917 [Cyanidiococcus yangmingshanensis]